MSDLVAGLQARDEAVIQEAAAAEKFYAVRTTGIGYEQISSVKIQSGALVFGDISIKSGTVSISTKARMYGNLIEATNVCFKIEGPTENAVITVTKDGIFGTDNGNYDIQFDMRDIALGDYTLISGLSDGALNGTAFYCAGEKLIVDGGYQKIDGMNFNLTQKGADLCLSIYGTETPSLTVTTDKDVLDLDDGVVSLREALLYAASDSSLMGADGKYTLTFDSSLNGKTIDVGSPLIVSENVVIDGKNVTMIANGKFGDEFLHGYGIFAKDNSTLSLSDVTIDVQAPDVGWLYGIKSGNLDLQMNENASISVFYADGDASGIYCTDRACNFCHDMTLNLTEFRGKIEVVAETGYATGIWVESGNFSVNNKSYINIGTFDGIVNVKAGGDGFATGINGKDGDIKIKTLSGTIHVESPDQTEASGIQSGNCCIEELSGVIDVTGGIVAVGIDSYSAVTIDTLSGTILAEATAGTAAGIKGYTISAANGSATQISGAIIADGKSSGTAAVAGCVNISVSGILAAGYFKTAESENGMSDLLAGLKAKDETVIQTAASADKYDAVSGSGSVTLEDGALIFGNISVGDVTISTGARMYGNLTGATSLKFNIDALSSNVALTVTEDGIFGTSSCTYNLVVGNNMRNGSYSLISGLSANAMTGKTFTVYDTEGTKLFDLTVNGDKQKVGDHDLKLVAEDSKLCLTVSSEKEAASLVVTTTEDVVDAYDGVTSLREAAAYANELGGEQTVTFDPSLAGNTVELLTSLTVSSSAVINGENVIIACNDLSEEQCINVTNADAVLTLNSKMDIKSVRSGDVAAIRTYHATLGENAEIAVNHSDGKGGAYALYSTSSIDVDKLAGEIVSYSTAGDAAGIFAYPSFSTENVNVKVGDFTGKITATALKSKSNATGFYAKNLCSSLACVAVDNFAGEIDVTATDLDSNGIYASSIYGGSTSIIVGKFTGKIKSHSINGRAYGLQTQTASCLSDITMGDFSGTITVSTEDSVNGNDESYAIGIWSYAWGSAGSKISIGDFSGTVSVTATGGSATGLSAVSAKVDSSITMKSLSGIITAASNDRDAVGIMTDILRTDDDSALQISGAVIADGKMLYNSAIFAKELNIAVSGIIATGDFKTTESETGMADLLAGLKAKDETVIRSAVSARKGRAVYSTSGDDAVELENGSLVFGDISLGAGTNNVTISTGARMYGNLTADTMNLQFNVDALSSNVALTVTEDGIFGTDNGTYSLVVGNGTEITDGSYNLVSGLSTNAMTGKVFTVYDTEGTKLFDLTVNGDEQRVGDHNLSLVAEGSDLSLTVSSKKEAVIDATDPTNTGKSAYITYTIDAQTYDGDTAVDKASLTLHIDGKSIALKFTDAAFNSKDVASVTTATFKGLQSTDANYALNLSEVTLNAKNKITAKAITVKADAQTKTYGSKDSALTYTVTGLVGSDKLNGNLTRTAGEDVGTYAIAQGTLSNSNYSIAYTGANLTITPKRAVIDAADPTNSAKSAYITYTIDAQTYDGDTAVDKASLTLHIDGKEIALKFTDAAFNSKDVASVTTATFKGLQSTDANYALNLSEVTLDAKNKITAKAITVKADAKSKVSGSDDPELTYTVTGLVGSDKLSGSLTRDAGEATGTYAIRQGTLSDSNYSIAYTGADLMISAKQAVIDATDPTNTGKSAYITYTIDAQTYDGDTAVDKASLTLHIDGKDIALKFTDAAFNSKDVASVTTATFKGLQSTDANYALNLSEVTLDAKNKITAKAITVKADAQTRTYGSADPALTYTVTGLVGNDKLNGNLTRTAGEDVGTYAITQGTLSNSNYTIGYTGANLTITPKQAVIDATDPTNSAKSAYITYTIDAQTYDGDTAVDKANLTLHIDGKEIALKFTDAAFNSKDVASVTTATFKGLQSTDANYALNLSEVTLDAKNKITAKAITVKADAQTRTYGSADPALTYTVTGLVGSDKLNGNLTRTAGEDVGTYAIAQGTLSNSNYTIGYTGANLTITPKQAVIDANDPTNTSKSAYITYTIDAQTYDGDTAVDKASLTLHIDGKAIALNFTDAAFNSKDVASVTTATFKGLQSTDANYALNLSEVTLNAKNKITAKAITVKADAQTKTYGSKDSALTYTVTGLVGSDKLNGNLTRTAGEDVGTYAIAQGTLSNSNYTIGYTGANLTITPKQAVIDATDPTNTGKSAYITYTIDAQTYDGDTKVDKASLTLHIDGKSIALKFTDAAFNSKDVASVTTATFKGLQSTDANYALNLSEVTLDAKNKITAKAITVKADAQTRTYGSADPALTYTVTGLVGNDKLNGNLTRTAGEDVGTYAIAQGTLSNSNYTIGYTGANLTITPKQAVIDATDPTNTGKSAYITYTIDAQTYDGDTAVDKASLTLHIDGKDIALKFTSAAFNSKDVASVTTATFKGLQSTDANYALNLSEVTLDAKNKITAKAITVKADAQTKTYGSADPALTYTVTGLVGSDKLSGSLTRSTGEKIGTYAITQGSLANSNYTISYNGSTLTITEAASLVVTSAKDTVDSMDNVTSLREAAAYAKELGGEQTVSFNIDGTDELALESRAVIASDVTVDGINQASGENIRFNGELEILSGGTAKNLVVYHDSKAETGGNIWAAAGSEYENITLGAYADGYFSGGQGKNISIKAQSTGVFYKASVADIAVDYEGVLCYSQGNVFTGDIVIAGAAAAHKGEGFHNGADWMLYSSSPGNASQVTDQTDITLDLSNWSPAEVMRHQAGDAENTSYTYSVTCSHKQLIDNMAVFSGAGSYTVKVRADQLFGTYQLAGNASGFNSGLDLTIGDNTYKGVLTYGSSYAVGDRIYTLALDSNNNLTLEIAEDSDDQIGEALALSGSVQGSLDNKRDVDMYRFTVLADEEIVLYTEAVEKKDKVDTYLRLFDEQGNVLASNEDGGKVHYSSISYTFREAGTYYVGVSGSPNYDYDALTGSNDHDGATGSYQLTLKRDGFDDSDDQISEAGTLTAGKTVSDGIDYASDVDMYAFTVADNNFTGTFKLDSTNDAYMRIFGANGNEVASGTAALEYTFQKAGTYYLGISGNKNRKYQSNSGTNDTDTSGTGSYSVTMTLQKTVYDDPDDTLKTAAACENTTELVGELEAKTDVDMYKFTVNAGEELTFTLSAAAGRKDFNSYLRLFDADGTQIAYNDDNSGTAWSGLTYCFTEAGDYYLGVSSNENIAYDPVTGEDDIASATGKYTLTVRSRETGKSYLESALYLGQIESPGPVVEGEIETSQINMYSFDVNAGDTVWIDLDNNQGSSLDSYFRLFDADGDQLDYNDDAAAPGEANTTESYLEYTFTKAGTYYLGVSSCGNEVYNVLTNSNVKDGDSTGAYRISFGLITEEPDDDDTMQTAHTVYNGDCYSGNLDTATDVDMFSVVLEQGQTLTATVSLQMLQDSYLRLFDSAGNQIACNDDYSLSEYDTCRGSQITYQATESGTYYLGVSGAGNTEYNPVNGSDDQDSLYTGEYALNITIEAATAVIADDSYEDNDTQESAADLGTLTGTATIDQLTMNDSDDWYRFMLDATAGAGSTVSLRSFDYELNGLNLEVVRYSDYEWQMHSCTSVFSVDAASISGLEAGEYYIHVYGDTSDVFTDNYSIDINVAGTPSVEPGTAENYVVLYGGGAYSCDNYTYYYDSIKTMYEIVTQTYNVAADHIYILFADGNDQEADNAVGMNSDMSFANDSCVLSATSDNLYSVFQTISATADSDDHFLFYSFGAGGMSYSYDEYGYGGSQSYLYGWNSGCVFDMDLYSCMSGLQAGYQTYLFAQDYSGGMYQQVQNFMFDESGINRFAAYASDYQSYPTISEEGELTAGFSKSVEETLAYGVNNTYALMQNNPYATLYDEYGSCYQQYGGADFSIFASDSDENGGEWNNDFEYYLYSGANFTDVTSGKKTVCAPVVKSIKISSGNVSNGITHAEIGDSVILTVNANVPDGSDEIAKVEFYCTGEDGKRRLITVDSDGSDGWHCLWTLTDLYTPGACKISAVAQDTHGNYSQTCNADFRILEENFHPEITSIELDKENCYVGQSVTVSGVVQDVDSNGIDSVRVFLDTNKDGHPAYPNELLGIAKVNKDGSWSYTFTPASTLETGSYTVYVQAVDALDMQTGETAGISFTLSNVTVDNFEAAADSIRWKRTSGDTCIVEYSQNEFQTSFAIAVKGNAVDVMNLNGGDYQVRAKFETTEVWNDSQTVATKETSAESSKFVSNADDVSDIFFASGTETWESKYSAKHVGSVNDWSGTKETVKLTGRNKITDVFAGSADANILLLTDSENGDALFVDDVYSAFPSDPQARIAQIDEILAGAGDDVVDMTSQRFEYAGDGLTVRGGNGDDVIWANKGSNMLFGDAGNDRIVGASGCDVIAGGIGNDAMHGGGNNDIFCFCRNFGQDTVEQLSDGTVTLWFAEGNLSNWDQNNMRYSDGTNTVTVSGVSADKVTLKFGDDNSDQFDVLTASGAFNDTSSGKIFDEEDKGVLVSL